MRRHASGYRSDQGLSETVGVILMVILVIALVAIIAGIVFGLAIFFPKSAYIVVQTEAKNVTPDNWYLSVFHANGDNAYLNTSYPTNEGLPVNFQFTTPGGSTVIPLTDPADGPETWKPGDMVYLYNKSGILEVTKNETTALRGTGLPAGIWRFDVVDVTDHVLIYSTNIGTGMATSMPTTIIPTPTVSTVPTTPVPIPGSIQGRLINGDNGQGLSGWTVRIYSKQGNTEILEASIVTDNNGFYVVTGLQFIPAEQYNVTVVPMPSGWVPVSPAGGYYDPVILNNGTWQFRVGVDFSGQQSS